MADDYEDESYGGQPPLAVMGFQEQFTTPEALDYARKILKRTVDSPDEDAGDIYIDQMKSNAARARAALKRARQELAARKYGNREAWLAAAAGFGAPTRTGSFGETISNVARNLQEPFARKREWMENRDKRLLDLDLALNGTDDSVLAAQLKLLQQRQDRDTKMSQEALKIMGRRVGQPQKNLDAAQQAVDREFAKDYVEFTQTGASDAAKGLADLKQALSSLKKRNDLTGKVIGPMSRLPWVGKTLQDVLAPDSSNVQEMVEYTVQRSLRPILGPQFTKEEGERLISRVYNNALDEKTNAKRLDRLIEQLDRAYKAKIAASRYFREHGTLAGFNGPLSWGTDDIWTDEDDQIGTDKESPRQGPQKYQPDPSKPPMSIYDLVPAGEDPGFAEGGAVGGYDGQMFEEEGMVPHTMFDGQVIYAPPEMPFDKVQAYYAKRTGQQAPAEEPVPDEAPPEEDLPIATEDLVNIAGTDPGLGAALGYGAAGGLGARYGVKATHRLADFIPGHKVSNAESRVLTALENEGLNPTEWVKLISQARRLGVPVTGLDMGGIEMRALGEQSMNPENKETRELYKELTERQRGSRERVEDTVNKSLKPDEYFSLEKKLLKDMQEGSGEAYGELYKQFPAIKSESLMQLMNTPSGKKAVKNAVKALRDRPGATIGKQDATGMVTKPSLEFLDLVKQELDDMINTEETQGGQYKPTNKGRRMRQIRNALRDEMDLLTTDKTGKSLYKEARQTHSGGLELRDALRFGREEFMKLPPKEIEDRIKDMNFSERDALRSGAAQAIFEQIGKTGSRVNPASKVVDTPDAMKRLRLLFDSPKEFEIFKAAMEMEQRIYDESKSTISKGRSKLSTTRDPTDNVMRRTAKQAPTLGILSPTQWALRYLRRQEGIKPKEAAEVLRMLKTGDPKDLAKMEKNLASKVGRLATRKKRVTKAGIAGAALGAAFPFIRDYFEGDEEEEPIKKAQGGLVRRKPGWRSITEQVLNNSMFDSAELNDLASRVG